MATAVKNIPEDLGIKNNLKQRGNDMRYRSVKKETIIAFKKHFDYSRVHPAATLSRIKR